MTAAAAALARLKKANPVAKTRPRTWPGTSCINSCVENTQIMPPPTPRSAVPMSTVAKLGSGAVKSSPSPPII
ncbi:MAG: hypothetical protein R2911_36660 [Caldilineaceae bacterium]